MIDWAAVRAVLARGYDDSVRGWVGSDPVVLFKMLLLERIYNLSDVRVSVEAGDRLSFLRFLALPAGESAPDDTTLVKFRARMMPGQRAAARREPAQGHRHRAGSNEGARGENVAPGRKKRGCFQNGEGRRVRPEVPSWVSMSISYMTPSRSGRRQKFSPGALQF